MGESFKTAREIAVILKVASLLGMLLCIFAFFFLVGDAGVVPSLIVVLPFLIALMVQLLFCEIARACIATAEVAASEAVKSESRHLELTKLASGLRRDAARDDRDR